MIVLVEEEYGQEMRARASDALTEHEAIRDLLASDASTFRQRQGVLALGVAIHKLRRNRECGHDA